MSRPEPPADSFEHKPVAEMSPAERSEYVSKLRRETRRVLAELSKPKRERKVRAGIVKPRTAAEWAIFGADHKREGGG
jgi:hypothetical protein